MPLGSGGECGTDGTVPWDADDNAATMALYCDLAIASKSIRTLHNESGKMVQSQLCTKPHAAPTAQGHITFIATALKCSAVAVQELRVGPRGGIELVSFPARGNRVALFLTAAA